MGLRFFDPVHGRGKHHSSWVARAWEASHPFRDRKASESIQVFLQTLWREWLPPVPHGYAGVVPAPATRLPIALSFRTFRIAAQAPGNVSRGCAVEQAACPSSL